VIFTAFQLARANVQNSIHRLTKVSETRIVLRDFRNFWRLKLRIEVLLY